MRKAFHIFLQTVFGMIVGGMFWALPVYALVCLVADENGKIPFEIFFGKIYIEGRIFVWAGMIWGAAQGFFIGLVNGWLNAKTILEGGFYGFTGTAVFMYLLFVYWIIHSITTSIYYGRSLTIRPSEFLWTILSLMFSIVVLFIPSFIIGMVAVKTFALLRAPFKAR